MIYFFLKGVQAAAGLKAFKPAARGHCALCRLYDQTTIYKIQTQKGSNECLFILTRTHSMQSFGEIPFIKPQNATSATDKWLKTMKKGIYFFLNLVLVEFLSLVQSFTAHTVLFFSFFIQEPGLLVCNWLWWWSSLFWLRCHLKKKKWWRGLKYLQGARFMAIELWELAADCGSAIQVQYLFFVFTVTKL